jgi:hypothetical protein
MGNGEAEEDRQLKGWPFERYGRHLDSPLGPPLLRLCVGRQAGSLQLPAVEQEGTNLHSWLVKAFRPSFPVKGEIYLAGLMD